MRRFWRNLPLASKIAGLASLLVILIVPALTLLTIQRERESYRQELESQADLLLATLPLTLRDEMYFVEVDKIQDIVAEIKNNPNLTTLKVYNTDGFLLVDASQDKPAFAQEADPAAKPFIKLKRDAVYKHWQDDQLISARTVWIGNQRIGAVEIGL